MNDLFWLTNEQIERLRPFFPKSHGKPRVDDPRVLSGIVFVTGKLRQRLPVVRLDRTVALADAAIDDKTKATS